MTRFCYQIQSHRGPEQIYRLVRAIRATSAGALVVVSHARDAPELDPGRLHVGDDVLLLRSEGGYADWSHTRRYLEVVSLLRARRLDYDWMINITGQDYPVRSLSESERELESSDADGFLRHFPVWSDESPWGPRLARTRYWYHHRTLRPLGERAKRVLRPIQLVNHAQPLLRLTLARGLTVGWRARAPFDAALPCYGGGFHASLRRECAEYVLEFTRRRPDLVAHYQRCLSPDESYLQTALLHGGYHFVNNNRRYVDFTRSRFGHPRVLTAADVEPARAAGAHFARKWDLARDPDAFDLMDRYVLDVPRI